MISVYYTIPNEGWIHKHSHFAACKTLGDRRYKVRHDCPTHKPYVDNLHACMNDFLEHGEDFWLSHDSDNPPKRNPLDLVELDLDLVGLPTPVWHSETLGEQPYYYNAVDGHRDGYTPHYPRSFEAPEQVSAIGSGCFLVTRRVIEALQYEQPFMREWGIDGRVSKGCDYSFCEKVRSAGFEVWAHFGYPCMHFNEVELSEIIRAFGEMKVG